MMVMMMMMMLQRPIILVMLWVNVYRAAMAGDFLFLQLRLR
jgi:uncharacterized membrane protein